MKNLVVVLISLLLCHLGFAKNKVKKERLPASAHTTEEGLNRLLSKCYDIGIVTTSYSDTRNATMMHFYESRQVKISGGKTKNQHKYIISRQINNLGKDAAGVASRSIAEGRLIYKAFLNNKKICTDLNDAHPSFMIVN